MPLISSIVAVALGGVAAGVGQIVQGVDANKDAKRVANEELRRAAVQAKAVREQGAVEASAKRAAAGASGLGGSGSLLSSLASIFEAQTQVGEILQSGTISAYNIRKQGQNAQKAGIIGGVGSIFTGLGTAGALGIDAGLFGAKSGSASGSSKPMSIFPQTTKPLVPGATLGLTDWSTLV